MMSSGLLRCVALVRTDVSEKPGASIRVTKIGELGKTQAATSNRRTLRRNIYIYIYIYIYIHIKYICADENYPETLLAALLVLGRSVAGHVNEVSLTVTVHLFK
jgi:hypothetical protein